jgi:hypothetical protein
MGIDEGARRRIAVVLADVLGEPPEIALAVASFLDGYLQRVPLRAAVGLRVVVWAVTWLPLFLVGVPLPAHLLPAPARVRYIERLSGSRLYLLREGFHLLKAVALMGWGGHPRVRERLGIGPVRAVTSW